MYIRKVKAKGRGLSEEREEYSWLTRAQGYATPGAGEHPFSVLVDSLSAVAMAVVNGHGAGGCDIRYLYCFKAQKWG